jgi:hypothetical protein
MYESFFRYKRPILLLTLYFYSAHQSELDKALNIHISGYEGLKAKGEMCRFAQGGYYTKYGPVDNLGTVPLEEIPAQFRTAIL